MCVTPYGAVCRPTYNARTKHNPGAVVATYLDGADGGRARHGTDGRTAAPQMEYDRVDAGRLLEEHTADADDQRPPVLVFFQQLAGRAAVFLLDLRELLRATNTRVTYVPIRPRTWLAGTRGG